jgi:hypothetical protein
MPGKSWMFLLISGQYTKITVAHEFGELAPGDMLKCREIAAS